MNSLRIVEKNGMKFSPLAVQNVQGICRKQLVPTKPTYENIILRINLWSYH